VKAGGGEGKRSKTKGEKRGEDEAIKKREVVVEKRKPNKEGASGTAGFGPQAQAQSIEARGRCEGPISGSTRDPALHTSTTQIITIRPGTTIGHRNYKPVSTGSGGRSLLGSSNSGKADNMCSMAPLFFSQIRERL
jgi:hypothetical protein